MDLQENEDYGMTDYARNPHSQDDTIFGQVASTLHSSKDEVNVLFRSL